MKLIGLISPNTTEETLTDVYKIFPQGIRIEGRTLQVGKYTDDEFHRAEMAFQGYVRELAQMPLDFLMVTGELFLSPVGLSAMTKLDSGPLRTTPRLGCKVVNG